MLISGLPSGESAPTPDKGRGGGEWSACVVTVSNAIATVHR